MDKYKIINHAMVDHQWYSIDELSDLVGFKITQRTIKALKKRLLILEHEKKYCTTQTDLFTITKTA